MACRLVLAALLLFVGGCQNRPPQLDPFLGKTTVPAPATGAVGAQPPGVLAYPAAPPSFTSPPPGTGAPTSPPPSSFVPNNSTMPRPLSGAAPPPNNLPSSPPATMNVSTPMRVVPPDPNRRMTVGPSTPGGIDIMDLPMRGQGNQPKTAIGTGNRGALQSYNAPGGPSYNVENAVAQVVTIPGQTPAYGFDETYSRLNGKLEYSSVDGRWTLRYVAPENRPDRFGGVVALVPMGSMNGFRSGDFVTADGRIDATGPTTPIFTATAVTPQREVR